MSASNNSIDIIINSFGSQEVISALRKLFDLLVKMQEGSVDAATAQKKLNAALREVSSAMQANAKSVKEVNDALKVNKAVTLDEIDALFGLAGAADESAGAVDALSGAIGADTVEVQKNTAAVERNNTVSAESEAFAKRMTIAREAHSAQLLASEKALGKYYGTLTNIAKLGTPELLKAGTYTAFIAGGIAYEGIKKYMEFTSAMTQSATQAGVAMSRLPALSAGVLNISRRTGQSANDLANAFYRVASGTAAWNDGLGASNKTLLNITDAVAKLNTVGHIAHGAASEQTGRVIMAIANTNLRDTGTDPFKAAAFANAVVGGGDIRMPDVISAFGRGGLVNAALNKLTAADIGSWVDLLTLHGTSGPVAGTYVKSGMNMLFNPTSQGAKGYAMLGINPQMLADAEKKGGLVAVANLIKGSFDNKFAPFMNYPKFKGQVGAKAAEAQMMAWTANQMSPELMAKWKTGTLSEADKSQMESMMFTRMFGGSRGFSTIAALVQYADQLKGIHTYITEHMTQSSFQKSYANTMKTPGAQFNVLKAGIMADLIEIGHRITPVFLSILGGFKKFLDLMLRFKPILSEVVGIMVALLGAAAFAKISKVALGLGKMFGGFQEFMARHGGRDVMTKSRSLYRMESEAWRAKYGDMALKSGLVKYNPGVVAEVEQNAANTMMAAATTFSEAVVAQREGAIMGPAGTAASGKTPGGGTVTSTISEKVTRAERRALRRAESAAARAEKEALRRERATLRSMRGAYRDLYNPVGFAPGRVARRQKLTYTGLNDAERRVAAREAALGRKLSRTELAAELGYGLNTRGRAWKSLSEEERAAVKASEARIAATKRARFFGLRAKAGDIAAEAVPRTRIAMTAAGERFASAGARVAEGAASAASKVVSIGSKFGGLLTGGAGLMGFLGGPAGMLAMTMLPMAMPMIGKFLGGLFSSKPAKPLKQHHVKTTKDYSQAVKDAQKKLAEDEKKLAGGNVSRWLLRDIQRQQKIIDVATGNIKSNKTGQTLVKELPSYLNVLKKVNSFNRTQRNLANSTVLQPSDLGIKRGDKVGMELWRQYYTNAQSNGPKAAFQWLKNATRSDMGDLADPTVRKYVRQHGGGIYGQVASYQASRKSSRFITKSEQLLNSGHLLDPKYARGNLEATQMLSGKLALQYKRDAEALKNQGLSAEAKAAYRADQNAVAAEIIKLRNAQHNIAKKNNITETDARKIGAAVATANTAAFKSLGVSEEGFIRAFGAAIKGNGLGATVLGNLYSTMSTQN